MIEKDALLASYCQLKTQFLPFWIQNGLPLGPHWGPTGTQWAPSGCKLARYMTNWVNLCGAIIFCKITYRNNPIYDHITIEVRLICTLSLILV